MNEQGNYKAIFRTALDTHIENIQVKTYTKPVKSPIKPFEGKYERAARLGLCFKCFREDTNPKHRPMSKAYGFCDECYRQFRMGSEKLDY